jgi:hypothetical protein
MPPCLPALCALVLLVGCATNPDPIKVRRKPKRTTTAVGDTPPPPVDAGAADGAAIAAPTDEPPRPATTAAAPPADPFGDVGFKEVTEKDWMAGIREKVSQQQKVDPAEVRLSPGRLRAAFVRSPPALVPTRPGQRARPRLHQIVVVDNQGQRVSAFRPITAAHSDEPPKDLRFLSEDRLVYEVVAPAPPEAAPAPSKAVTRGATGARQGKSRGRATARTAAKKSTREPPTAAPEKLPLARLFVIQPIAPGARPIRCTGFHFAFTRERDRLAFVSGQAAESTFVSVDGVQVYPRRGRTAVSSAPVWSKDGRSLAFLESPSARPTRLVLLAEFDNPTGDTTWDLPPTTSIEGTLVFWAGSGKLLVGKTAMRPVFSASFTKEAPTGR